MPYPKILHFGLNGSIKNQFHKRFFNKSYLDVIKMVFCFKSALLPLYILHYLLYFLLNILMNKDIFTNPVWLSECVPTCRRQLWKPNQQIVLGTSQDQWHQVELWEVSRGARRQTCNEVVSQSKCIWSKSRHTEILQSVCSKGCSKPITFILCSSPSISN